MKNNNMTNWDVKKAFSTTILNVNKQNYFFPTIYIDEYWDYYINEFGLTEKWNDFLKNFLDSGFTYKTYIEEYNSIINDCSSLLLNCTVEEAVAKISENITPDKNLMFKKSIFDIENGEYLFIDIHSAFDTVLKYLNIFNSKYESTYEIIESVSDNKIFHNNKILMSYIYHKLFSREYIYKIFNIINSPLFRGLYDSENPDIKYINDNCNFVGITGDSMIFKIPNGVNVDALIGEHSYTYFDYHIDYVKAKEVCILDTKYKLLQYNNRVSGYNHRNLRIPPELLPLASKLINEKEINEKDLAYGYEDQIFFYLDNPTNQDSDSDHENI